MKKYKKLTILIIISLFAILLAITGCTHRLKREYHYYSFESLKGNFVQYTSKFIFKKDSYFHYDETNTITNLGEYFLDNDTISLVPDKVGDTNRIALTESIIFYKDYLIDLDSIDTIYRYSEQVYGERSQLEGQYTSSNNNTIYLDKKKIYISSDNSNIPQSFTTQIGTYVLNKNKDFLTFCIDGEATHGFLIFDYIDEYGKKVKGLTSSFYCSKKKIKFSTVQECIVEMQDTLFLNKAVDNNPAQYDLALTSYPNGESITEGVSFSIISPSDATIDGNTLKTSTAEALNIKYEYKHFKGTAWIYITDFHLKSNLTASQRTFHIGDEITFQDLFLQVAEFTKRQFSYETVQIKNSAKAEVENGKVTFLEVGTIETILTLRDTRRKVNGEVQVLEIKQTIYLIVVP